MSVILFGNPWHGLLGTGTIELETGTPISEITIDGVEYPVTTLPEGKGLGDTRYLKKPDIEAVETPASMAAMNGEWLDDAIIYSSDFRYSPLCEIKVLEGDGYWLLWDETALRWRKMSFSHVIKTLSTSPLPTAGSVSVECSIYRGALFGQINVVASGSYSLVDGADLLYSYNYRPAWTQEWRGYIPGDRRVTIDANRDGTKILVRLEAKGESDFDLGVNQGFPSTRPPLWDSESHFLVDVWEITLTDDGATMSAPVRQVPEQSDSWGPLPIPTGILRSNWRRTVTGDIYWEVGAPYYSPTLGYNVKDVVFKVPVQVEVKTYNEGVGTSKYANAAYDKEGVAHIMVYRHEHIWRRDQVGDSVAIMGYATIPENDDPEDYTSGYDPETKNQDWTWSTAFTLEDPPYSIVSDEEINTHTIQIADGSDVLAEWSGAFGSEVSWKLLTNNVASIEVGGESVARVGPGVVDDTVIDAPCYASFNPRTGVIVSSDEPIGFV